MRYSKLVVRGMLVVACASRVALAQGEGPGAGTWGIEGGSLGGASLLHFRSQSSATVIGATAFFGRVDDGSGTTVTFASTQLRLGIRQYREARNKVRRFSTTSAILGYERSGNPGGDAWIVGAAEEIGAAYFITPRVSMGGSGELSATYGFGGGVSGGDRLGIAFGGLRLLGGVYF